MKDDSERGLDEIRDAILGPSYDEDAKPCTVPADRANNPFDWMCSGLTPYCRTL